MSQSKEIFRAARSLIEEHGEGAVQQAAIVISDRHHSGDADGAELWRNIQAAISILREIPDHAFGHFLQSRRSSAPVKP